MSDLLQELDPSSLGKPTLATEIPVWVAYVVEWLEVTADPADRSEALARVAALKARFGSKKNAERAFWRLKAGLAPTPTLRALCRRLARGQPATVEELRAAEESETHPLRWSLLSDRPESIVECLQFSEGHSTRARDETERAARHEARKAERKSALSKFLERIEAADSDV